MEADTVNPVRRLFLDVDSVRLCCMDFGGEGPAVLLVHGLAGRGNEWRSTAEWLRRAHRVFALDQRGHGQSEKPTGDYSRDAYVRDLIGVIERLQPRPALLIGQSMGGINAFLAAARRPDLVRGLIAVEASPAANPSAQRNARTWLEGWPLPFPTLADAKAFFGGDTLYAQTWLEVLEERPDGYWPQFDIESMAQSMADVVAGDHWDEWERVRCPTLVVGGANSFVPQEELREMVQRNPHARFAQIADAGHDLHLEQPEAWREAAEEFLRKLSEGGSAS